MADEPRETDDDLEVDLDLDAEDQLLREAIGKPVRIRVAGEVISIPNPKDWPHAANTAASRADFGTWAALVLSPEDLETFTAANLCYRLIKHADAKRVLFLVDRSHHSAANLQFRLTPNWHVESGRKAVVRRPMLHDVSALRTRRSYHDSECGTLQGTLLGCASNVDQIHDGFVAESIEDAAGEIDGRLHLVQRPGVFQPSGLGRGNGELRVFHAVGELEDDAELDT